MIVKWTSWSGPGHVINVTVKCKNKYGHIAVEILDISVRTNAIYEFKESDHIF